MKISTKLRRWSWELPQSILGAILLLFYKTRIRTVEYKDQEVYIYDKFPGGISLGYYVLVRYHRTDWNIELGKMRLSKSIKHESGHGIQSKWLGPLYLPTVGLLSLVHNIVCRIKDHYNIEYDYYKFFVEKSANKLGGVK